MSSAWCALLSISPQYIYFVEPSAIESWILGGTVSRSDSYTTRSTTPIQWCGHWVKTEVIMCEMGVRQGENLSPVLFAIYLNDFNESMKGIFQGLKKLDDDTQKELETFMRLYVLYADDTIILAENAEDLQVALNGLSEYYKKWCLKVNTAKTKIIVFARGKVRKYTKFQLGSNEIEVVEQYVYLGILFNYNGSFKKAIDKQITQARKAMFAVIEKAKVLHLPVDIVCELFYVCVVPVLLYGSEIWGFENLRDVEIFHRGFMRLILKVLKFTPNTMPYGELGATDMSTIIHKRMINFWLKLKFSPLNKFFSIMCRLMSKLHIDYPDSYDFKWCSSIQSSLDAKGFSEVWNVSCIDIDYFKEIFAQRCDDIFLQNWHTSINENSQCTNYSIFKQSLQI